MGFDVWLAEALGIVGGGIAVVSTIPLLAKQLARRDGREILRLPGWLGVWVDGGERQSRLLLATGNAALALSLSIDGSKLLAVCAVIAMSLNLRIWQLMR
ncbi:MAG: hypothetical protein AAGG47_17920 [Pseudomonadota bacterium]